MCRKKSLRRRGRRRRRSRRRMRRTLTSRRGGRLSAAGVRTKGSGFGVQERRTTDALRSDQPVLLIFALSRVGAGIAVTPTGTHPHLARSPEGARRDSRTSIGTQARRDAVLPGRRVCLARSGRCGSLSNRAGPSLSADCADFAESKSWNRDGRGGDAVEGRGVSPRPAWSGFRVQEPDSYNLRSLRASHGADRARSADGWLRRGGKSAGMHLSKLGIRRARGRGTAGSGGPRGSVGVKPALGIAPHPALSPQGRGQGAGRRWSHAE
jgi:hypothetical protein